MPDGNSVRGVVIGDTLAQLPIGTPIPIVPVPFTTSNATAIPQGATNWTFFEGAILMVVVRTAEGEMAVGTAAIVAPGLAISATHVLADHLPEILAGTASLSCMGPASTGLDIWQVRKISTSEGDDIAYLSLELTSAVSIDWRFRTIALTTRAPRNGETLHVVGFQIPRMFRDSADGTKVTALGNLYLAAGSVTAAYPHRRDPLLLPYPCIEIACGSLNGMSGGAVLDASGCLVGVISRGFDTEDGQGPSYAAWIVGALNRSVEVPWPPGIYSQPVHLLDIDARVMLIKGRDRITAVKGRGTEYQVWFE